MIETFLSVLAAIALLLVLIVVHEAGHFFAARYFGMQTPVVGLGLPFFGPTWVIAKYKDIEFRFHPVLLGAYVAIPEMDDESSEAELDIHLTKPKQVFPAWQRMIVSFAGPGANFAFAFFLAILTVLFLGVPSNNAEMIFIDQVSVNANNDVKQALKSGDRLFGLNGELIKNNTEFRQTLESTPNKHVSLWVERIVGEHKVCTFPVLKTDSQGHLRIALGIGHDVSYKQPEGIPIIAHLQAAWQYFAGWFTFCLNGLWYLVSAPFKQLADGPKLSEVHGVIFATNIVAQFLKQSASSALQWGSLLSIELGIFNLIPILPLDGGHIFFQGSEMITRGKKLPQLKQYVGQTGLVLILMLTCLILFNDLRDLIFRP